jgi:tRNA pseudouridine38-40 synthase
MVRGLTGTMLKVATGKMSIDKFKSVIESKNNSQADFSVPGHGLFLVM